MSPEQARGDLESLGPRSDVSSLGATLYCLLTGRPPFEGDDVGDVLRAVQRGEFPPPRRLDASIDRALEAVCLKAMALRPEDRYHSPTALAEDLERWMADEPVSAWREPWTRALTRWLARHRTGMTAAGSALLVALAGVTAVLAVQARLNRDLAAALVRVHSANVALAEANARVEASNEGLKAANAREVDRFSLALDAIRLFHGEVSEDFLLKEKPFQALRVKLLSGAADFYGKLERRLRDQDDPALCAGLAGAYEALGVITADISKWSDALAVRKKALAIRRELATKPGAGTEDLLSLAKCLSGFAESLGSLGDVDGAFAARREALLVAESANAKGLGSANHRLVLAKALIDVGKSLFDAQNKAADALAKQERAREILRDLIASDPGNQDYRRRLAMYEGNRAIHLGSLGRMDEAIVSYRRAIELHEQLTDPSDPNWADQLARIHNNFGGTWITLGRPDKAMEEDLAAHALWRRACEAFPNSTMLRNNLAFGLNNHGILLEQMGRVDNALQAYQEARDILRTLQVEDPSRRPNNLVDSFRRIGLILLEKGDAAGAMRHFQEELACVEAWAGRNPENPMGPRLVAGAYRDIGKALIGASRPAEALTQLRKAQTIDAAPAKESANAPFSAAGLADDLWRIGLALSKLGDAAGAAAMVRRAIGQFEGLPSPDSADPYAFACARATLSALAGRAGSDVSAEEGRVEADRAMTLLRLAIDNGEFYPGRLQAEPALEPLRSRLDFQVLLMDLVMPAYPFVRD